MKLFRFDAQVGRPITQYGSTNVTLSPILHFTGDAAHVVCMHIAAGGVIAYHQAMASQLFLVVQGAGWVRGEADEPVPIIAGQAAFWQEGEWHESGSQNGMMAIVIEGKGLDPARFMASAV